MEGLYVRFKETDHSIWIRGTHKYGMVKSGPNSMSSASLRKLYTVGDAITSFKTAVAPDVDGSSINLHFEPSRESISSDCLLAAIQLENSFENPLYIKSTPPVSSIKSKDSEAVKYGKRKGEMFLDRESAIDFNLQPTTTMTTPHKLVKLEGVSYFMENEVKGPYLMGYDWRDYKALVSQLKMPGLNQKAFKVTVGTKVEKRTSVGVSYDDFGEIVYKDDEFIVGSVTARIRKEWYNVMYIKVESRHQGYRFFQLTNNSKFEE
ncbi:hypothetical protein RTP6_004904 [Batrachochytrium dendrobatidis]